MEILRWYDVVPLTAATLAVVIAIFWDRRAKRPDPSAPEQPDE